MPIAARRAARVYYVIQGVTAFAFALMFTVNLIWQAEVIGLNPLQLVLVGTVLEVVIFFLEIPTGVVADVYSRRLSVLIGFALIGAGFLIEGLIPTFAAVLVNQVIWGLGATFTSGALEAWIADEVGEAALGETLLRGSQVGSVLGIAGTVAAAALGSAALNLPIVVGALLFILLTLALLVIMPETGFTPAPRGERRAIASAVRISREALTQFRGSPVLLLFLGMTLVAGVYSEGFDRLWRVHLSENTVFPTLGGLEPIVWFSAIALIVSLTTTLGTEIARRRIDTTDRRAIGGALLLITIGRVGALAVFAVSGDFVLAVAAYLLTETLRAVAGPLQDTWANQHIDSASRATVISALHQGDAFGQIAGGPLVGAIGLRAGLRAAMLACAALLAPLIALIARARRIDRAGGAQGHL